MKNHARALRSNYQTFTRRSHRLNPQLRRTLFGRKLSELKSEENAKLSSDYEQDIDRFIDLVSELAPKTINITKNVAPRRSLFKRTIASPYHHKNREIRYQPKTVDQKAESLIKRRKSSQRKLNYRHTRLKLSAAFAVLLIVATSGYFFNAKHSNRSLLSRLYPTLSSVNGPPIDISATPAVLGANIEPKNPGRVPSTLNIPALGMSAAIEPVGAHENGTVGQTQDRRKVGWYMGSAPTNANSTVLLVGYRFGDTPIFSKIDQLKTGDVIEVRNHGGDSKWYKIQTIDFYAAKDSPLYRLVTENQGESLVIASNNGVWDDYKNQFSERIIIVSKPVDN